MDVTAGVEPAAAPELTTKIWNDGPPEGAGAHWKAQPMFQVPPAIVKAGLVQLPVWVVCGTRTVAGPTAAAPVVAVVPPATVEDVAPATVVLVAPAVVVAVEPAAVVAVEPPAAAEAGAVVADAPSGGSL